MNCSDMNVFFYGKPESLPEKRYLRAGQLEVVYENGCLRYLSVFGQELVRNIYSAVRDRNWGTIVPVIVSERVEEDENSFNIRYKAHYVNTEIDFVADYEIRGTADNVITFSMSGKALKSFMKNRIGFCILHPLDGVKGELCRFSHPDNTLSEIRFPEQISPHQPATNITAMEWENTAAKCYLGFEGDLWEMEDHRNWTDSSFKTYCTPLSVPFPAKIEAGEEVVQKISFSAKVKTTDTVIGAEQIVELTDVAVEMPQLGTIIDSQSLNAAECDLLKEAPLGFLRYDLKFSQINWEKMFAGAVENAAKLNLPIELVIHFSVNAEKEILLLQSIVSQYSIKLKYVWFVDEQKRLTTNMLVSIAASSIRKIFPGVPVGGGTDAYFAEFNRNRFDASALDFVTYAVCPQVHAFDNDSLVENFAAQADTVESAKILYAGKPVHVSPVTLKQRFNVVATGEEPPVPEGELPPQVDERQMSLYAAGWTLGSLVSLARQGVRAITYYYATGWKGIVQGQQDYLMPHLFAGGKGDIYPVYHLLRFLKGMGNVVVKLCNSSHPLKFTGLFVGNKDMHVLIVANHTNAAQMVKLKGVQPAFYFQLSGDNVKEALKDRLFLDNMTRMYCPDGFIELNPYALLFGFRKI